MTKHGLRIRHLVFLGPSVDPAKTEFHGGLNVIYGSSDTGKSFIVEAIDFMLGGKPPLKDIPEREGYDHVLLGLETLTGEELTLVRSVDGGNFRRYSGLHESVPDVESEHQILSEKHSDKSTENLSAVLLAYCDLAGKRIRKNAKNETWSLSFRHLARLLIVDETEIIRSMTPLSDGNVTADTANLSAFKLLLTGVDDSALVPDKPATPEEQTTEAQVELLDQLLKDYKKRLRKLTSAEDELEDQLQRLESALRERQEVLSRSESEYKKRSDRRRLLRERLEEGRERLSEIYSLLERFTLLDRHYDSDTQRLKAIAEAGTLFTAFGRQPCPLCGATPESQQQHDDCDGNTELVAGAAQAEISKIALLRLELERTVNGLVKEKSSFERKLPKLEDELSLVAQEIQAIAAPQLTQARASYANISDKRGEVREALSLRTTLLDLERRRSYLAAEVASEEKASIAKTSIPTGTAQAFSDSVAAILKAWSFPETKNVHFDPKTKDLVIDGKQRFDRGKGLRAITHAAFTIGMLEYCYSKGKPHPGFVVLDSPLLTYRAPDGSDDDLSGTDLNEKFYDFLAAMPEDRQVIIVENTDPPDHIKSLPNVLMFTKNPHQGRYGFFPVK